MPSNVSGAISFVIGALARLYLLVLVLRFWLPWLKADFRNPLAQAILRLSSPLVVPLRRLIPAIGRLDSATLLVAFAIQYLTILVILLIDGRTASVAAIALTSIVDLVLLTLNLFMFAIIVRIILSWVAQGAYNPAFAIITTLTEPILQPFRRYMPRMGGLDISPLFAIIIIIAATILIGGFKPLQI
jgi:YggT family protein